MTSAAADRTGGRSRGRRAARWWLVVGWVAAGADLVLSVLIQAVNHDFFPPQVSVSQYGVGPRGWVFTLWTAMLALAVLALTAAGPGAAHHAFGWLGAGSAGLLVMGIVRTDAGGLQHSWHAKLHMAGAVLALLALPVGMRLALTFTQRRWRRIADALVVCIYLSLVLVLASAAGLAFPAADATRAWAFWQAVTVTLDMMLLAVFALAMPVDARRSGPPGAGTLAAGSAAIPAGAAQRQR